MCANRRKYIQKYSKIFKNTQKYSKTKKNKKTIIHTTRIICDNIFKSEYIQLYLNKCKGTRLIEKTCITNCQDILIYTETIQNMVIRIREGAAFGRPLSYAYCDVDYYIYIFRLTYI